MEKRHGKLQRLLAMCLSLMMALVLLAPSAFAAGTEKITINKPSTLSEDTSWAGLTVTAYQVFTQSNNAEKDNEKLYEVTEAFADFFNIGTVKAAFGQKVAEGSDDLKDVYLYYDGTANTLKATNVANDVANITNIHLTAADKKVDAIDTKYGEADLVSRIASTDAEGSITAQNGDIAIFYTWIEKYIEGKKLTSSLVVSVPNASEGKAEPTSVEISGLEKGYYALIFSEVPTGVSVIQGILVKNNTEVNLKAEELPLIKQVKNPNHKDEDFSDTAPLKETTANVGDTLEYDITSKVPTVMDSENLTKFQLEDTLTNQKVTGTMTLTLSKAGQTDQVFTAEIVGTTQGQEILSLQSEDKKTTIAKLTVDQYNKQQTFTIDFLDKDANNAWKNYQGYDITVHYYATVTADAVRVNGNDVKLFINDWDKPLEDKTEVYTYGIEVQKTFSDTNKPYNGVKFNLYAADSTGAQTQNVIELVGGSGVYHKKADGETAVNTGTNNNLVLDTNGKLTITGLDEGTYWLVETDAPDGYNEAEPIKIVLTAKKDDQSGKVTGVLDGTRTTAQYKGEGNDLVTGINDNEGGITLAQFNVFNQKGFNLPQTGGAGTWMFTVGGIVLIAAAGALFLASRKKRSSK